MPEETPMEEEGELKTQETGGEEQNMEHSIIEKAEKLAKTIEEGNKKFEELVARNEKTFARNMLGGSASGGKQEEKKKEETPKEYFKRLERGELTNEEYKKLKE